MVDLVLGGFALFPFYLNSHLLLSLLFHHTFDSTFPSIFDQPTRVANTLPMWESYWQADASVSRCNACSTGYVHPYLI